MAQNTTRNDGNAVDWRDELQVRAKVDEWAAGEQAQSQRTDYVESRVLGLIKELEQIVDVALSLYGDQPPDDEKLNEPVLRIGQVKPAKPS